MKKLFTIAILSTLMCFNATANTIVENNAKDFREGFLSIAESALKGLAGESRGVCYLFEDNYSYIISQDWFMQAGLEIENAYNSGDQERVNAAALAASPWVNLMDDPDVDNFSKHWNKYFKKERGMVNSYRCLRSGDDFIHGLLYTARFMGPEWKDKLYKMEIYFRENEF